VPKKKKVKKSAVDKLGKTLSTYKTERINAEEDLKKIITKVNLDKQILFKEK